MNAFCFCFSVDHVLPYGNLHNIIPEFGDHWEISFKTKRIGTPTTYQNILHFTASPIENNLDAGKFALYINFQHSDIKIQTPMKNNMGHMIQRPFPENQEVNVRIIKHTCEGCPVRVRVFFDEEQKYGFKTPSHKFQNVTCYAPGIGWETNYTPFTDLKFSSSPLPIYGK